MPIRLPDSHLFWNNLSTLRWRGKTLYWNISSYHPASHVLPKHKIKRNQYGCSFFRVPDKSGCQGCGIAIARCSFNLLNTAFIKIGLTLHVLSRSGVLNARCIRYWRSIPECIRFIRYFNMGINFSRRNNIVHPNEYTPFWICKETNTFLPRLNLVMPNLRQIF
jgi:hypothetical protein